MTIGVGSRLGPCDVIAHLGAGGMGEVFRARDAKLGRDVAIKILPAAFTTDPERLARFEREARVLASLNHLHIAGIFGLEERDGVRALVLELVEVRRSRPISNSSTASGRRQPRVADERPNDVGLESRRRLDLRGSATSATPHL